MEKALGIFHKDYFSSPPTRAMRGFFFFFTVRDLSLVFMMRSGGVSPKTVTIRSFSTSHSASHNLSKLPFKCCLPPVYGSSSFFSM